jgi:hypothetical protein
VDIPVVSVLFPSTRAVAGKCGGETADATGEYMDMRVVVSKVAKSPV